MENGLRALVAELPPGSDVVEVGSWAVESAWIFLQSPNVRSLVMVDSYDLALCQDIVKSKAHRLRRDRPGESTDERTIGLARERLMRGVLDVYPKAVLLQMPSVDAARALAYRTFDAVYIDGSHDMVSVRQDITAWRPRVRSGGLLAGHDYVDTHRPNGKVWTQWRKHGVKAVVDEDLGGPDRVFSDTSWIKRL